MIHAEQWAAITQAKLLAPITCTLVVDNYFSIQLTSSAYLFQSH